MQQVVAATGSMSFAKSDRLLKSGQFKSTLDTGRKALSRDLVVFACPSSSARLGLVVSRKVGNAVVRNRVKRSLREAYRMLAAKRSFDVVVIARSSAAGADFRALADGLGRSMLQLGAVDPATFLRSS